MIMIPPRAKLTDTLCPNTTLFRSRRRGHVRPGGGCTAVIATTIAFLLLYMANVTRLVEASLSVQPVRWIAVGLVCAVATGLAAWLFGYPFLTSHSRYLTLPLIGDIPLASALLFEDWKSVV